jgi:hypothetical protein
MNIIHPVEEVISRDTVVVHPVPVAPYCSPPTAPLRAQARLIWYWYRLTAAAMSG